MNRPPEPGENLTHLALVLLTNGSKTNVMTSFPHFKTALLALCCIHFGWHPCKLEGQTLRINECMAANSNGLLDEDGDTSDWIEIWNYGSSPVSLAGLYLSDDPQLPDLWPLPSIRLDGNEHLIVFASGKDRRSPEHSLHCNFELDRKGEFLSLNQFIEGEWMELSAFNPFPPQKQNVSYGYVGNAGSMKTAYFLIPSPGTRNRGESVSGFVKDTRFSMDRGYYDAPFDLIISTGTPGATLAYTTDGTLPSPTNGTQVLPENTTEPSIAQLKITDSTLLRAMAYKDTYSPTNVDTHSYFFHGSLLKQGDEGEPFDQSVRWGHAGPDWEMDPEIVTHANPEIKPAKEDFLRLPTLSIAMHFNEMFGRGGIYIAGQSVEKQVSAEWLNPTSDPQAPNKVQGFQKDATLQIVGGSSPSRWKSDKLSMRLKFDQDLNYPVFGEDATDRFDTLVIDARLNNVWHYGGGSEPVGQRERAQYVRDQYAANLHNAMGGTSPHGRHAHVMINGIYWGIHTIHERPDDNFTASYLGGSNEDYDSIKHRPNDVLQGSSDNYNQLHALAGRDLSIEENYAAVSALLDIDDFIDYMLMNYYIGNGDWAHHNWYASFNRIDPDGRWRFHSWDAEKGLHGVSNNVTGRNDRGGPTFLQHQLIRNEGYRFRFADRAYDQLRHGVLTPQRTAQMYREITDPIDLPIRLESARWGDNQKSRPYTRLDWIENRDSLFGLAANRQLPTHDFFKRRSEIVLSQFKQRNWLPFMEPPVFNQHGGHIPGDFKIEIQLANQGSILYTLDGSDPMPAVQNTRQTTFHLVSDSHEKHAIMPEDSRIEDNWMQVNFDDSDWPRGNKGAGYENRSGYEDFISSTLDFHDSVNQSDTETIYMRVEFEVEEQTPFDRMELGLRFDDGFIAYLNGFEIARSNARGTPDTPAAWNASASSSHSDAEAVVFQSFDVTSSLKHLKQGTNVLAIHGLNVSATSSDFLIWPVLKASVIEEDPQAPTNDQVMTYASPFTLTQSSTIKARVNRAGRWSALLSADFIVDAMPVTAENISLSAIHYHPTAPVTSEMEAGFQNRRDFEFLELHNPSAQSVDLRGLRFISGIDFEFDASAFILELNPGKSLIIASNQEAFESRFGTTWNIAGTFRKDTNLNNGGERIAAINSAGQIVLDVTYSDQPPWPTAPDGQGSFLTLSNPDKPGLASAWNAASESVTRAPAAALQPYLKWLENHFTADALDRPLITGWTADPDLDGMNNLLEYFHGSDPSRAMQSPHVLKIHRDTAGDAWTWQIEFSKITELPGIEWSVEHSTDLQSWTALGVPAEMVTDRFHHYSWNQAASGASRFFRLKLTLQE